MASYPKSTLLVAAAVLLLAGSFFGIRPVLSTAQLPETPAGTISVSGSSAIRVQPDRVVILLGVENFADSPRAAQQTNADLNRRVLAAIRDLGIPDKDVSTTCFSLDPEYENYSVRRTVEGYYARTSVKVALSDVKLLESLLVSVLESGATSVDGVEFSVSNLRELRDQARAEAIQAAMEKATAMAEAAHMKMGTVTSINENSYYSGYYGYYGMMNRGWTNSQNVFQDLSDQGMVTLEDGAISLGQVVVRADIGLSAELVP